MHNILKFFPRFDEGTNANKTNRQKRFGLS